MFVILCKKFDILFTSESNKLDTELHNWNFTVNSYNEENSEF